MLPYPAMGFTSVNFNTECSETKFLLLSLEHLEFMKARHYVSKQAVSLLLQLKAESLNSFFTILKIHTTASLTTIIMINVFEVQNQTPNSF